MFWSQGSVVKRGKGTGTLDPTPGRFLALGPAGTPRLIGALPAQTRGLREGGGSTRTGCPSTSQVFSLHQLT